MRRLKSTCPLYWWTVFWDGDRISRIFHFRSTFVLTGLCESSASTHKVEQKSQPTVTISMSLLICGGSHVVAKQDGSLDWLFQSPLLWHSIITYRSGMLNSRYRAPPFSSPKDLGDSILHESCTINRHRVEKGITTRTDPPHKSPILGRNREIYTHKGASHKGKRERTP